MSTMQLQETTTLPRDGFAGALIGRVWRPDVGGPSVVLARGGSLFDITAAFATVSALCEAPDPAAAARAAPGERLGSLAAILANTPPDGRDAKRPWLLAPIDLQAIKAAGVTFASSMIERVIEERARGERAAAERSAKISLSASAPSYEREARLARRRAPEASAGRSGLWSQYLEVGLGPDAEIFTKSQPMSAVGTAPTRLSCRLGLEQSRAGGGARGQFAGRNRRRDAGQRRKLARFRGPLGAAARQGQGPERELRDRPVPAPVRRHLLARRRAQAEIGLSIAGEDGFTLQGGSSMARISRDPADLVAQLIGPSHQYPDGAALFLGTMFAPVADRDAPGRGFTHKPGDLVTVSAEKLGALTNRMRTARTARRGTSAPARLMRNLARRGLI